DATSRIPRRHLPRGQPRHYDLDRSRGDPRSRASGMAHRAVSDAALRTAAGRSHLPRHEGRRLAVRPLRRLLLRDGVLAPRWPPKLPAPTAEVDRVSSARRTAPVRRRLSLQTAMAQEAEAPPAAAAAESHRACGDDPAALPAPVDQAPMARPGASIRPP